MNTEENLWKSSKPISIAEKLKGVYERHFALNSTHEFWDTSAVLLLKSFIYVDFYIHGEEKDGSKVLSYPLEAIKNENELITLSIITDTIVSILKDEPHDYKLYNVDLAKRSMTPDQKEEVLDCLVFLSQRLKNRNNRSAFRASLSVLCDFFNMCTKYQKYKQIKAEKKELTAVHINKEWLEAYKTIENDDELRKWFSLQ